MLDSRRADELARLVDAASPVPTVAQFGPNSIDLDSANLRRMTPAPPPTIGTEPAIVTFAPRLTIRVAPGIKRVRAVPRKNQLRYCSEGMLDASRDAVVQTLASVAIAVEPTPLAPKFCGNVRPNHFELWLGSDA